MINAIKLFGLDPAKLPPCHGCEKKFSAFNPPTDMGVYVARDGKIQGALLCRSCRDRWFDLGAFTFNLASALQSGAVP